MAWARRQGWMGLWLAVACLGCRDSGRVRQVEATAGFDPSTLDFGEVPVGEWRTREVQVLNGGYVPFRALEVLQQLQSPSFVVEMEPGEVRPGLSHTVVVRFHPLGEGEHEDTVTVFTDADSERQRSLPVTGRGIRTPVRITPNKLDFDNLEINSERTLELTVENPVDLPVRLTIGGMDADLFDADQETVEPHSTRVVRLRYRPNRLGPSRAELEVRSCASCTPTTAAMRGNAVPSAFVFDPSPVPFQEVPVHERTTSSTRATNIVWRPVQIQQLVTSDSFRPLNPPGQLWVMPGQSVPIELEYAARYAGPAVGTLRVEYVSDGARVSEVELDARGGRAQLALAPAAIDFGELPAGGKLGRVVRLTNAGANGNLQVLGIGGRGDTPQFNVSQPFKDTRRFDYATGSAWPNLELAPRPIAPGDDYLDVEVYFQPEAPGAYRAEVVVRSDDLFNPERVIIVTGRARASGPCRFRVLPAVLNFGNVPAGQGAVLGFRFENTSTTECAVKDIQLSQDAGGAFFMPGGPLTGGVVIQDDSFAAQIAFRSPVEGTFAGELTLTVNDPTNPVFRLPLLAVAHTSCLVAAPGYLDFGPIRYDCAPIDRRTLVSNRCPFPVAVSNIRIGEGTSTQFSLTVQPPLPLSLGPGEGFELQGSYSRTVHGQHFSPLYVESPQEPAPYLIPMLAETNHEGVQVETFVQGTSQQLDVLVVVGNTSTMEVYQDRLKADVPGWISEAQSSGVDMRVGVTTTGLVERSDSCPGGARGGEAGRLFPVDGQRGRVAFSARPDAAMTLQRNLEVGSCHNLVQGLETMRAGLSPPLIDSFDDIRTPPPNDGNLGFLRDPAQLAVVFLSDEDDHSGFDPESYVQFLQTLKGPNMGHRVRAFAIVPTDTRCVTAGPPGPRFAAVANRTAGAVLSICEGSYASLLRQLTLQASGAQAEFVLQTPPSSTASIVVRVDGRVQSSDRYHFEPARNAIVFHSGHIPTPGQTVQVRYRSACPGAP